MLFCNPRFALASFPLSHVDQTAIKYTFYWSSSLLHICLKVAPFYCAHFSTHGYTEITHRALGWHMPTRPPDRPGQPIADVLVDLSSHSAVAIPPCLRFAPVPQPQRCGHTCEEARDCAFGQIVFHQHRLLLHFVPLILPPARHCVIEHDRAHISGSICGFQC